MNNVGRGASGHPNGVLFEVSPYAETSESSDANYGGALVVLLSCRQLFSNASSSTLTDSEL